MNRTYQTFVGYVQFSFGALVHADDGHCDEFPPSRVAFFVFWDPLFHPRYRAEIGSGFLNMVLRSFQESIPSADSQPVFKSLNLHEFFVIHPKDIMVYSPVFLLEPPWCIGLDLNEYRGQIV